MSEQPLSTADAGYLAGQLNDAAGETLYSECDAEGWASRQDETGNGDLSKLRLLIARLKALGG